MSRSVSLGQFYPCDSPLHRLDGRIRIIAALIYMVMSFVCDTAASFILLIAFSAFLVIISKVPLSTILKSVKGILIILLITFIMNIFFFAGEGEPLFRLGFIAVYTEGIIRAVFTAVRILALVVISCLLFSYTATPVDITHSIEGLFAPIKFMRRPIHTFSMMMFIALRFIPTLSDDADKIMTAQKSRGADYDSGRLFARIKSLVTVLIPLFVSSFRRADELAVAMECRCYNGGIGRTRMTVPQLRAEDFVILGLFIAFGVGIVLLNSVLIGGVV